ncbi:Glycosyltransferase involved in cell wall bisynthesis [Carnobacterium iners]|uniref:Glycosyltransferase involved in cell wall bisynthesis n=1 Tax=Carnobacterium iners TaxID=1073423 RepID=A0A1X7N934_9LACT|nr:glycosyltransferase [Carnobacterium iners]SEL07639.1 Glycosyltransferase involved in cell wall bisynthesis [Carnobacterium iners]SMH33993.1 Glycosyltransferase involved in cell wall bisynthesis [Carnobacterium iners]
MKKTVHYFCFGVDDHTKQNLYYFPSAQPKIQYIIDTLKNNEYMVNMVSSCSIKNNGFFKSKIYKVDNNEKHVFFSSFKTPLKVLNKISIFMTFVQFIFYMLFCVKKNDIVLIYHSLYYIRPMELLKKLKKVRYILEVEELYSFLDDNTEVFMDQEIEFINYGSAYLLVNDLIDEKISRREKKAVISYGNYSVPPKISCRNFEYHDYINVVYAGVIENRRKAAFIAIESAKHLNEKYCIHILGFGEKSDIINLKKRINEINKELSEERIIFHGTKSGDEYSCFLQSCDVALSTHSYDKKDLPAADYSFPSKIITYMANGLKVVSSDVRSVRYSKIGRNITFYEKNTPEDIAKSIESLEYVSQVDSREKINELDKQFKKNLKNLIDEF